MRPRVSLGALFFNESMTSNALQMTTQTDFITTMLVNGTSPDQDFEFEVFVVEEKETFAVQDPELEQWALAEYAEDKLGAGVNHNMALMRVFGVVGELPASSVADEGHHGALDTSWAKLFASTPVLSILKIRIVASMPMGLGIIYFVITSPFLHAFLSPDEPPSFVSPPPPREHYPGKTILHILKRAAHGPRYAPEKGRITSPHK